MTLSVTLHQNWDHLVGSCIDRTIFKVAKVLFLYCHEECHFTWHCHFTWQIYTEMTISGEMTLFMTVEKWTLSFTRNAFRINLYFHSSIWYRYSPKSGWTHVYKTINVSVRQSAPPLHLETDNTYNSPLSWPCYASKYKRHQSKAMLVYLAEMFGSMRQLRKLRKEDHEASLLLHTKDMDYQKKTPNTWKTFVPCFIEIT